MSDKLKRTVTGPKSYRYIDKNGDRKIAEPGATIEVTAVQAKAFAHMLIDPEVAAANKKAEEVATKSAQEDAEKAEAKNVIKADKPEVKEESHR